MTNRISFTVAPYALYDTLRALLNQSGRKDFYEVAVTKEDGNLVILCTEKKIYKEGV